MSAAHTPLSQPTGPEHSETQETYHRARAGLIGFMDGGCGDELKKDLTFVLRGDHDCVVKLWTALCAVELHFGKNPVHAHTKYSRQ